MEWLAVFPFFRHHLSIMLLTIVAVLAALLQNGGNGQEHIHTCMFWCCYHLARKRFVYKGPIPDHYPKNSSTASC